jgi:alpha-mannosidase
LENRYIRLTLNDAGDIVRIYDKVAERDILPAGAVANQWQMFEDRPLNWDAWDIDIFYDDTCVLAEPAESVRVVEAGPLRATLEIRRRIGQSAYVQRISLSHTRRQIDFETEMDWQERHMLLKVAFPVEVLSPVASYEVQWGHVQRPTHRNTSWDWARFETCAQKWVDLSEGNYGVALLNDCKYGHDIRDRVIRLSLLRAPTDPDPTADRGAHSFRYSLLPHDTFDPHMVAAHAYALNDAVLAVPGTGAHRTHPQGWVMADGSAIVETVKQAEDGRGVIVRLYEGSRQRGWVEVEVGFDLAGACVTDLLEQDGEALRVEGRRVRVHLSPFQIITVRLVPA